MAKLVETSRMTDEVAAMIRSRHAAEQRGSFSPVGQLTWMRTEHGRIEFPVMDGELSGPDLAISETDGVVSWLVLGDWMGLPSIRRNANEFCPECLHDCDVCGGSGFKLCELCGGASFTGGKWLVCPGPGCTKKTGNFNAKCAECRGSGQVREQVPCLMCDGKPKDADGFSQMVCMRCRGTKRFPTGRLHGSMDWEHSPKCGYCEGSTFRGTIELQSVSEFTNARLTSPRVKGFPARTFLVVGPIYAFGLREYQRSGQMTFGVSADAAGDFLNLLVPASDRAKPQKAYLLGGSVYEQKQEAVGA